MTGTVCAAYEIVGDCYRAKMHGFAELDLAEPEARKEGGAALIDWKARRDAMNGTDRPIVPLFLCGLSCDHAAYRAEGLCKIEQRLMEFPEEAIYAEQVLGIRLSVRGGGK